MAMGRSNQLSYFRMKPFGNDTMQKTGFEPATSQLERKTGFEPATFCMASKCSTN